ncbi:MAG TPA: nucleotide sugar dehydrogenase, partial [Nocardioidaceae bacterium]
MAELGHDVVGLEVDADKLAVLEKGHVPFHEPGLDDLLEKHVESGRLRFTDDPIEAAGFGEVHFICVGTPQQQDSLGADLTYVYAAVESLAPYLRPGALVVGKSTVPVGTAAQLARLLDELSPPGAQVELAWNPEFLREGYAVKDTLQPDRLVFGLTSEAAEAKLRSVYARAIGDGTPVVVTDYPTAELVKVSANAFLATKISFINAVAEICEITGADVKELADAIGYDDRIG